jgi:hypothetical protein
MVTFAYPSTCYFLRDYTVKKASDFLLSQPGCQLPNSPWPGLIKLFPAGERLVNDIPERNGKIVSLFYSLHSIDLAILFMSAILSLQVTV